MGRLNSGFTLVELMIVVAIIGVLAAFAYPNYQEYVRQTNRTEVKSELLRISQEISSQKAGYKRFNLIPMGRLGIPNNGVMTFPRNSTASYTVSIVPVANGRLSSGNWTLRAQPIAGDVMDGDGDIKLNFLDQSCWDKANNNCTLSATSNWDD